MRILVTGGAGRIGQIVSAHLQQQGYQVRATDTIPEGELSTAAAANLGQAEYEVVDICDYEAVYRSMVGIESVVHLAGIPLYLATQSARIFQINTGGTFNLYQAAAEVGVKRVVAASSINFLGNGFGRDLIDIKYFPVDEAHPGYSIDTYAFSKQMLEEVADYFWRFAAISSVSLRLPMVYSRETWLTPELTRLIYDKNRSDYELLSALPEEEMRAEGRRLRAKFVALRNRRTAGEITFQPMLDYMIREPGAMILFGCDNFWSVIRDWEAARAIELALRVELIGNAPLYIGELENSTGLPSRWLAELLYPEVGIWHRPCTGTESLLDTTKAERLLGFETKEQLNEGLAT